MAKKKTKVSSAKKKKRAKQLEVPGTERHQDAEIRKGIDRLTDANDVLSDAQEEREAAALKLVALMEKKKLTTYLDELRKVRVDVVTGSARVKVKRLEKKKRADAGVELS